VNVVMPSHRPSTKRAFPFAPIVELIVGRWDDDGQIPATRIGLRLGVTREQVHRWRYKGLGIDQADALAVRLGLHPVEIWPDWYRVTVPTDEEIAIADRYQRRREGERQARERRAAFEADPRAWRRNRPGRSDRRAAQA